MEEVLTIKRLGKDFFLHEPGLRITSCADVTLTLYKGEFIGISGPSGAGKSTILKCIYRCYMPTAGSIIYNSESLGPVDLASANEREILYLRRYEIGYVSQFLNVMPRTTAKEHVISALANTGISAGSAENEAGEILSYFKLPENLWNIYPATFSGGEKLRLNLAHAMVKKPRLLLLDEPTASLDGKSKDLVKDILEKLKSKDTAMIGIFHDVDFMEDVCGRVIGISGGVMVS